ncbi:MAG TPA: SDR family NAD(P)-dependent oxidoreductase, partial [Nocardioides sp.]|uniref:SDR family oxidoreductase n=1 Tax=Nocardioides sp. TaxID=35761 RepID=UPI002BD7F1D7
DFPTLNHVVAWVRERTGAPAPAAAAPAAAAPAAAPAAPAPVEPAAPPVDPVLVTVTRVVAEMTGYPAELLDPDLDLEADLGVDTVKQAEVFAAVRAEYDLERDENLQLRDFPTLNHVVAWVRERTGAQEGTAESVTTTTAPGAAPVPAAVVRGDLAAIDALPRRLPVPSLRPGAADCAETGIDLQGARVLVALDEGGAGAELLERLAEQGATGLSVPPDVTMEDLSQRLDDWLAEGPVHGVYWLPALDDVQPESLEEWQTALARRVKNLYTTMRRLWDSDAFLVAATRLGGYHGYDAGGATSPLGGAVTGFAKSYRKERPEALVKAVDVTDDAGPGAVAEALVEETLRDPGCVEIGRAQGLRFGVAFVEEPFPPLGEDGDPAGSGGLTLDASTVAVVTGAAGSIVSAITADLALASGGTFHLLDLTPEPDPGDPDLAAFAADRDGLKAALAARLKDRGERPTPVAIEHELARIERLAAAQAAIDAVHAAGGTAHYHCVDLRDPDAVAQALAEVGDRVDVLLHAAGLEISRNLPDKEPGEFDLVLGVKADGWFNVWRALREREVGAVVVFSSVAGRFGNNGQTDYSAANDLLCKTMSSLRRTRPDTRALALDWTAWGGIGMATRGSIPKIMEMAGVQMLPPEAGVAWIRRELASSGYSGEVIVAGELGLMAAEPAPGGGLAPHATGGSGPMAGSVRLSTHDGVVLEAVLDPTRQPFLDHHRIDGTAVLPGVMGMEAFVEAATVLCPPGFTATSVEQVSFATPVKFYRDEPRTLRVTAVTLPDGSGDLVARCVLSAERTVPGREAPLRQVHFTGRVRLSASTPEPEQVEVATMPQGETLAPEQVYSFYFHGPAYQVVDSAWRSGDGCAARLTDPLPADREPPDAPLATAPRLVELCFQAAGLWEAGRDGQLALPMALDRVSVPTAVPEGPLVAVTRPGEHGGFDCLVVDDDGRVVVRADGYRTVPVPMPIPEDVAGALRATFAD